MIAALALVLAIVGYELWPRDAARIERVLEDAASALNRTHDEASLTELRTFLRAALLPTATVRAAELDRELEGIDAVTERARDLLSVSPLKFSWSSIDVTVSGRLANVDADLVVAERGGAEQRQQSRRARMRLVKREQAWLIEAVEVDAIVPSEPEARP